MKIKYNGKVTEKGLHIYNRGEFDDDILLFNSKEVTVTIEKKKKNRSLSQNSYYWGVVVPLVREGLLDVGYKVGLVESHEYIKNEFSYKEIVNEITGEVLKTKQSTTSMTTTEFIVYLEQIQRWGAEFLNIQIPDPGEQIQIEL